MKFVHLIGIDSIDYGFELYVRSEDSNDRQGQLWICYYRKMKLVIIELMI